MEGSDDKLFARRVLSCIVEVLSDFKTLRNSGISNKVKNDGGNKCAICEGDKSKSDIQQLEAAHIVPVEEGGESCKKNLLPLCRRSETNLVGAEGNMCLFSLDIKYKKYLKESKEGKEGNVDNKLKEKFKEKKKAIA